MNEARISEYSFVFVTYTLQNVGKKAVDVTWEPIGDGSRRSIPYGTITLIYDDGYIFGEYENSGFVTKLDVLGDPVKEIRIIDFPNQVLEHKDKPVKLKVTLPNSNGETEDFIVSIR